MRFDRARAMLIETLRAKGIRDERVLAAIGAVPRHEFVEPVLQMRAWEDEALPIGLAQTISQPFTVAFQTELLDVQEGERILEVGTGSGYQAAVLAALGARVFSVERHKPLLERTNALLERLGYRVRTRHGDGTQGWSAVAPFDAIVVTAGGIGVPPALLEQMRPPVKGKRDARLVIPVGGREGQTMLRITRVGPGPEDFVEESFGQFRFVPLVGKG